MAGCFFIKLQATAKPRGQAGASASQIGCLFKFAL
jgi:hypothetical protein